MTPRVLSIECLPISSLRLDPQNPRLHSAKQIRQLASSIETFGFNVPVLADAQLRVIAGHGRVLACKLLEIAQIPVIRLEHLSESQIRAFMIADNRLTENSEWDKRLLGDQFKILSEAEIDFSLEVTGFEMGAIDMIVEGPAPDHRPKRDPADEIPDARTRPQVTRTGDLWIVGRHRVYCGDALNDSAYSVLMERPKAKMVFADPPYNDPIDGAPGEISESGLADFLRNSLAQLARNSVAGAPHFICMDWRYSADLITAARSASLEFKDLCVWVTDIGTQGSLYRNQHELVFVFMSGKEAPRHSNGQGPFGRNERMAIPPCKFLAPK